MNKTISRRSGFTLVEVLISLFVIILIGSIGISSFYSSRDSKNLDVVTDSVSFVLEQAKASAIAGKNGSVSGVMFDPTSFTYFDGSTYTPGAPTNKVTMLPSGWKIATSSGNGKSYLVFSHLSGTPQTTAKITISKISNPSLNRAVLVNSGGDVTVLK